ncbi:transcriptional regulator [Enterococcus florum]|uniref:Transcriptional regulator n=1 Tax=Enterococcus florum TaxID=2480627 RepID=A0A4P5P5X5_9ENTE|nr:YafY family protein [Enterococcus florum]GCF93100.1 transcriptional regulator [Enterococcus florum]
MHIQRLFKLTMYLLNKRAVKAQELADYFEVSVRTIFRDLDVLSNAGIPIYTVQGTGGGIFIDPDFVLSKATLTKEEQTRLVAALQSWTVADRQETTFLLDKLRGLFQTDGSELIEIDFSRWGHSDKATYDAVMTAITQHRNLAFSYIDLYQAESTRTVCPLKLLYQERAWYLKAYEESKGHRIFKLNRINDVVILEDSFSRSTVPLEQTFKQEPQKFDCISLEVCCTAKVADRLYDEFPSKSIVRQGGSYLLKIEVPQTPWLESFLLSLGTEAEVIRPLELRNQLAKTAEELYQKYRTT